MGLGAPKKRAKLSHDPNNTAWSRSTSNFGHRILAQQGWQPGQYLGAENANHSDHYTAANASHIRVMLREDNLGLGAKVGGNKAETFGLSLFSGVLGRLNGKSDEQVQKQQDALRDAELRQYQVGKYGMMNFVSGGLLVGDRMQKPGEESAQDLSQSSTSDAANAKHGKKRKASDEEGSTENRAGRKHSKKRKETEVESAKVGESLPQAPSTDSDNDARKSKKAAKKAGRAAEQASAIVDDEVPSAKKSKRKRQKTSETNGEEPAPMSFDDKARLKQEKRARKEDRRRRKEEKHARKEAKREAAMEEQRAPAAQNPPPTAVNGGRHAVRHRYIQQKRMAGMDAQAMKEIFMIKAAA